MQVNTIKSELIGLSVFMRFKLRKNKESQGVPAKAGVQRLYKTVK